MIFFFGIRSTLVLNILLENLYCSHCGQQNTVSAQFIVRHFHFFWIPIFPIGKKVTTTCSHCKQNFTEREMPGKYRQIIEKYKPQAKARIWQWSGLLIVGSLFALFFLMGIIGYLLQ